VHITMIGMPPRKKEGRGGQIIGRDQQHMNSVTAKEGKRAEVDILRNHTDSRERAEGGRSA